MGCEGGSHLWTASFFQSGALAFWFCSRCGETDREVGHFPEPLEDVSGASDDIPAVTFEGERPYTKTRRWHLADGSILEETEPGSTVFRGMSIPGLPDSHSYVLTIAGSGDKREFIPRRDRSSTKEDCFILTRFRVQGNRLVKYRIHCCECSDTGSAMVDEPSGNTILTDLEPFQN